MTTALVMTAFQRQEYLRRSLESWARARSTLDSVSMRRVFIEPSAVTSAMVRTVADAGWVPKVNANRLGVLVNPVESIGHVFRTWDHVDFVILAEEDIVVAADVLEYFAWCREEFRDDQTVGVVCAHRPQVTTVADPRLGAVLRLPGFSCPLVWGTWRDRWFSFIEPTWDRDYTYQGWDWHLKELMAEKGMVSIVPEQNRSDHIGEFGGMHCMPGLFPETIDPAFYEDIGPQEYWLAGEWHERPGISA